MPHPHAQDQQRQQHDCLGAKHELFRQAKRVRAITHDRHRKNDQADGQDDREWRARSCTADSLVETAVLPDTSQP